MPSATGAARKLKAVWAMVWPAIASRTSTVPSSGVSISQSARAISARRPSQSAAAAISPATTIFQGESTA